MRELVCLCVYLCMYLCVYVCMCVCVCVYNSSMNSVIDKDRYANNSELTFSTLLYISQQDSQPYHCLMTKL